MRARHPDLTGVVVRDGVDLGYEVFGEGSPAILLMPTWTIIHSRFWKMQVPYLARRYRVITYDGPGNGASDRVTDPARYAAESYARDAISILDDCGVDRAVVVGLSLGAQYSLHLAGLRPDRVAGLVLVGPALPLGPQSAERAEISEKFFQPYPVSPQGWDRYNLAYWHDHYEDFARFFFSEVFSEPHSTKPQEDAVGWALEGGAAMLEAEATRPESEVGVEDLLNGLQCPLLVFHGTSDRIQPYRIGVEAARLGRGALITMVGAGHMPNVRDPVRFNLALSRFVERVAS